MQHPPPPQKTLMLPGEVFEVAGRTAFVFTPASSSASESRAARPLELVDHTWLEGQPEIAGHDASSDVGFEPALAACVVPRHAAASTPHVA